MDLTNRGNAVHIRHLPVNQHKMIILLFVMAFLDHIYRLHPVHRPVCMDAKRFEIGNGAHTEHFIIVHNQYIPFWQHHILLRVLCLFKVHNHMKAASLALLAAHFDSAAHKRYNAFRDRSSKARSDNFLYLFVFFFPRKRVEDLLLKLFRHADACILHHKMRADIAFSYLRRLLPQMHIDPACFRCKFYRIGQQVQQHLI